MERCWVHQSRGPLRPLHKGCAGDLTTPSLPAATLAARIGPWRPLVPLGPQPDPQAPGTEPGPHAALPRGPFY